jgi:predicted nuclease of restriction endonuclease-like (RecB) superfamily
MEQTLANGWSRNILALQIDAQAHARQGKTVSNFGVTLPSPQSDLVRQTLKDPYIFDFLTLTEPFHERELETQLVHHLEKFLLELGQGFLLAGKPPQRRRRGLHRLALSSGCVVSSSLSERWVQAE